MSSGYIGGKIAARITRGWMLRYGRRGTYIRTGVAALAGGLFVLSLFGHIPPPDPSNRRWALGIGIAFTLAGIVELLIGLRMKRPGLVDGTPHSTRAAEAMRRGRRGELKEAEALLLRCIDAMQEEATLNEWPVSAHYYEELARIYRITGQPEKERAILERCQRASEPRFVPRRVARRLAKLRASAPAPQERGNRA